ncbi:MAG: VOC family protein [Gammaproteobacteria bacterium]|jgi:catechol 2,3-dioxygenase-like lactoylglutathione lyase family enzyme
MGHVHYYVPDVARTAAFWETLGGARSDLGDTALIAFPGIVLLISQGEVRANSLGAVVGHIAFRVASVAAIEERGIALERNEQFPGVVYVYTPDGERIELFDDGTATNIGFDPDTGVVAPAALRHNAPLAQPVVSHHMHFYVPEGEVEAAQRWYVDHFGAAPGTRWRYTAADLPGINLNFSADSAGRAPTRGRMLDHIGFEVVGLKAFVAQLQSQGIRFDTPYRQLPSGLGSASLTDPWGAYIELTEGLGTSFD